MNDITAQLRRGIKSTGFVMAVVLQLFALTYVHMDAGLFWRDPLEYFQCGDFYYTFFISTEQGLHWLAVPIVAILPMGFVFADDHQSGYINLILYRQRRRNYVVHRAIAACLAGAVAMLTALLLYTGFIALVTPWTNEGTGWQEIAMIGPYGWRASSDYFYVLIFECFGRLALSAVIWTLYGLALSNIWRNRIFIIVAVIATNLFLESFVPARMGIMNSLSYLQIPQCGTDQPLTISLLKQLIYFSAALGLFIITALFRFSPPMRQWIERLRQLRSKGISQQPPICLWTGQLNGTALGRLAAELRCCCTFQTLVWSAVTGCFTVLLSSSAQRARFSVGDVLLECYGGMEWACPLVSFSAIARWTMLLLPPMLGVALNIEREMGTRSFFTMNRYQSKTAWWTYKGGALLIYVVLSVGVMLMATTLAAYAAGAQGFAVFGEDAQGFSVLRTDIVWMAMILFAGHVLMLTQLQILVHSISNDMRLGILCYIVPVVLSAMMASNVDLLWNEHIPYNWGMVLRTDLFSISGYYIEDMNGLTKWLPQCCLPLEKAVGYQIMAATALFAINHIVMRLLNITSRKQSV